MNAHSVTGHVDKHTPRPMTHVATVRARNRAEQRKAEAINCVIEHLEYFGVLVAANKPMTNDVLRHHATQIVNAALALTRAETH
jgi:hypothetical protein